MKLPMRVLLIVLCAALIVGMPFFISSPSVLQEAQEIWQNDSEGGEEGETLDFGRLFFSCAFADELDENQILTEEVDLDELLNPPKLSIPEAWELPFDFSIPPVPDPDKYVGNGYEDRSIRVRVETKVSGPDRTDGSQSRPDPYCDCRETVIRTYELYAGNCNSQSCGDRYEWRSVC